MWISFSYFLNFLKSSLLIKTNMFDDIDGWT